MSDKSETRESRQFWAVSDEWEVKLVTGYECPPNYDMWWVPQLGYSMSTKHHLFKTADAARRKAIKDLQKQIDVRQAALSRLHLENQT